MSGGMESSRSAERTVRQIESATRHLSDCLEEVYDPAFGVSLLSDIQIDRFNVLLDGTGLRFVRIAK